MILKVVETLELVFNKIVTPNLSLKVEIKRQLLVPAIAAASESGSKAEEDWFGDLENEPVAHIDNQVDFKPGSAPHQRAKLKFFLPLVLLRLYKCHSVDHEGRLNNLSNHEGNVVVVLAEFAEDAVAEIVVETVKNEQSKCDTPHFAKESSVD